MTGEPITLGQLLFIMGVLAATLLFGFAWGWIVRGEREQRKEQERRAKLDSLVKDTTVTHVSLWSESQGGERLGSWSERPEEERVYRWSERNAAPREERCVLCGGAMNEQTPRGRAGCDSDGTPIPCEVTGPIGEWTP